MSWMTFHGNLCNTPSGHNPFIKVIYAMFLSYTFFFFLLFKSCKKPLHVCTDHIDSNCMICNLNNYVMVDVIFLACGSTMTRPSLH